MSKSLQTAAPHLRELNERYGALTPEIVIAEAKHPNSPLHDLFEWNIEKAAYRHWIERAREIIRTVRLDIQVDNKTVSTVRYVHDTYAEHEQGYADVLTIRNDERWSQATLDYEVKCLEGTIDRVRSLAITFGMEERFNEFLLSKVTALEQV